MTSIVPSDSLRKFLAEACEKYEADLWRDDDALVYLTRRGLSEDSLRSFRLGVVGNPLPGHESYASRLAIPYLTKTGVTSMRFRCLTCPPGEKCIGHAKYLGLPGDILRPFNPSALDGNQNAAYVCITEGEIDAITATQSGLLTVGLPGVSALREYTPRMFVGYEAVYILADNDDKGQGNEFAEKVANLIANSRVILMPQGHDVNSFVCAEGPEALRARLEK